MIDEELFKHWIKTGKLKRIRIDGEYWNIVYQGKTDDIDIEDKNTMLLI